MSRGSEPARSAACPGCCRFSIGLQVQQRGGMSLRFCNYLARERQCCSAVPQSFLKSVCPLPYQKAKERALFVGAIASVTRAWPRTAKPSKAIWADGPHGDALKAIETLALTRPGSSAASQV